MIGGIGFSSGLFGYEDYKNAGKAAMSGVGATGFAAGSVSAVENPDEVKKAGRKSSPQDCETCKNRKYQDGSDEQVSFKSAAHISPKEAGARVRGHEQEHVVNAYAKAAEKGGKVLHAGVSIHTAVCPECGRTYVAGGETSTVIKYPKDGNGKKDGAGEAMGDGKFAGTPGRNGDKEDFSI